MSLVATLGIVEDSEVLASLLNANNVHNTERESGISSDFVVNLDKTFLILNDLHGFLTRQGILQSVSKENAEGDAFSALVGTG